MRSVKEKKCLWCPKKFYPEDRLKERQKSCGSSDCKRKQNLLGQRLWKKREREDYRQDQKDWRRDHPDYWKSYRKEHPKYTERNRIQSRIRWRQSRQTLQKKLDILEVTGKQMKYWNLPRFAKDTRSLVPLLWAYADAHELANHSTKQSP